MAKNEKPLVFPSAKPIGVNSASSRETITDGAAFPTEVIDYLKFDVFDHKSDVRLDSIYLYLPKSLSESHSQGWGKVELGKTGAALMDAAGQLVDGDTGNLNDDSLADSIQTAAEGAMPALGYKAATKVINAALATAGGDVSLDRNQISSIVNKTIFNPYAEATYEGQSNFRGHSWTWEMVPKSTKDAMTIYDIIRKFRGYALPGKDGDNWLTIPEYFRLTTVRYIDKGGGNETIKNPDQGGPQGILSQVLQFPTKMVCTGVNVSMPDFTSLRSAMTDSRFFDFGALKYSLKLDFKETEFLTKETYGFTDHMPLDQDENEDGGIVERGDGYRTTVTENGVTRVLTMEEEYDALGLELRVNGELINNPERNPWARF